MRIPVTTIYSSREIDFTTLNWKEVEEVSLTILTSISLLILSGVGTFEMSLK